jgi:hypothetical protein
MPVARFDEILVPMVNICGSATSGRAVFCYLENSKLLEYDPIEVPESHSQHHVDTTLQAMLSDHRLRPRHRLSLAVHLASSILQLHSTPWLSPDWFQQLLSNSAVDPPYVQARLNGLQSSASYTINPYLVGLGIILLELSEQKPFDHWIRDKQLGPSDVGRDIEIRAELAWTWLKEIAQMKLGGSRYKAVVRRCLESTSTLNECDETGMFSESTRKAIYREVVHELEIIYNVVTGQV